MGVVYAVLLGFTAIIVWESFREAQRGVELEANSVVDLYRNAQVFPRGQKRSNKRKELSLLTEQAGANHLVDGTNRRGLD